VSYQKAVLDKIGFGEISQKGQIVFIPSSVNDQKGVADSDLMEGILALQPQHGAGCKCSLFTISSELTSMANFGHQQGRSLPSGQN
jgi:hypothetical protein